MVVFVQMSTSCGSASSSPPAQPGSAPRTSRRQRSASCLPLDRGPGGRLQQPPLLLLLLPWRQALHHRRAGGSPLYACSAC